MSALIETLTTLNTCSTVVRILLAMLLGGIIGLERGHHGRAAGLRTHILVCLGAAMASLVGLYSVSVLHFNGDPMRVGAQVVSGIGFLGVGTIMVKNKQRVTGLTTAAGLWATASIGLAVGIGYYIAAIAACLAVSLTMVILVFLENSVGRTGIFCYYVELSDVNKLKGFYEGIRDLVSDFDVIPAKSGIASHVGVEVKAISRKEYHELINRLQGNGDVVIALPRNN